MRESISESWTIQIVAAFILLFVAFLALMISYSKCFKTKNEVISIAEKYRGFTDTSVPIINGYLNSSNYKGSGKCKNGTLSDEEGSYGMPVDGDTLELIEEGKKYKYCIYRRISDNTKDWDPTGTLVTYEVVMFYSFNIPAFGNIATFEVSGNTVELTKNVKVEYN